MGNRLIVIFPDHEMSANEFAHIASNIDENYILISLSAQISSFFTGLINVEIIPLYNDKVTNEININTNNESGMKKKASDFLREKLLNTSLFKIAMLPIRLVNFRLDKKKMEKILGEDVKAAFIPSDRGYISRYYIAFLSVLYERKISIIIPKFAEFATKKDMLTVRKSKKREFSPCLFDWLMPKGFIDELGGNAYVYYHFDIVFTMWLFDVLSDNPWVMGGSNKVDVCVNNNMDKKFLLENGVDTRRVFVTGSYKYSVKKVVTPGEKVEKIGLALPQTFEHGHLTWETHISLIEGLVRDVSESIDAPLLIFLHPKMRLEKYHYLESRFNCVIQSGRTDEQIPYLDMFIATYSSTVFTALAYGVPAIVIDLIDSRYDIFSCYPEIKIFNRSKDLSEYLQSLTLDTERFKKLKEKFSRYGEILEENPGEGMNKLKEIIHDRASHS